MISDGARTSLFEGQLSKIALDLKEKFDEIGSGGKTLDDRISALANLVSDRLHQVELSSVHNDNRYPRAPSPGK